MGQVTVDFIAKDQPHGGWSLVLVEEGPWEEDEIADQLRRIQDRLYGCLDAIVDGQVSDAYPDSSNKPLEIRVDAYNVPEASLSGLIDAFSANALDIPDYKTALESNDRVPSIIFSLNYEPSQ